MSIESYPLCWPAEYPRTGVPIRSRFGGGYYKKGLTLYKARERLDREIRLLGGEEIIISTNMRTRQDGGVYSNAREPSDPGIAVYFKLDGQSVVLSCDRWCTVKENTYAVALSVSAMRSLDRWGVSEILKRVFTGFAALPAPNNNWWEILNVDREASTEEIRKMYRQQIKQAHPDVGGTVEFSAKLNEAYKRALKEKEAVA